MRKLLGTRGACAVVGLGSTAHARHKQHRRFVPALAAISTLVSTTAGGPAAASEGDETRIAWSRFDQTFSSAQIVAADPDGGHLRQLTHPRPHTYDLDPVISPEGRQIVFERDHSSAVDVVIIDARGRDERVIDLGCVDPCALDVAPSWTADGRRIVFTRVVGPFDQVNGSARSAVLYTADPDGSDVHRLSEPGIDGVYEDVHARYAPDGTYLTFLRWRNEDSHTAVFRMSTDGSDVRQLTPWDLDADLPDLSLATRGWTQGLVVFETFGHGVPEGSAQNIATVPASCVSLEDCTNQIQYVTSNGGGPHQSFNPSWSPDGHHIAYVEFEPGEDEMRPPSCDIWTVRPDGSGRSQASTSRRCDFRPDWGPSAS